MSSFKPSRGQVLLIKQKFQREEKDRAYNANNWGFESFIAVSTLHKDKGVVLESLATPLCLYNRRPQSVQPTKRLYIRLHVAVSASFSITPPEFRIRPSPPFGGGPSPPSAELTDRQSAPILRFLLCHWEFLPYHWEA